MDLPLIDRLRGFMFDLVHNVDTFRPAPIDDFDVVGDNKHFGTAYRAPHAEISAYGSKRIS